MNEWNVVQGHEDTTTLLLSEKLLVIFQRKKKTLDNLELNCNAGQQWEMASTNTGHDDRERNVERCTESKLCLGVRVTQATLKLINHSKICSQDRISSSWEGNITVVSHRYRN